MSVQSLQTMRATKAQRPAAVNRTTINFRFDLLLGGLMLGTAISAYIDTRTHILFGVATSAAILVHLGLHWNWITAAATRLLKVPANVRYKAGLGLLMLLVFVPLLLSGAVVGLIYAPQVSEFHRNAFYVFGALLLTHLVVSWRWIAARLRRRGSVA